MPLLREFLDENIHRSYPFATSNGVPNSIPTPLIVDFGIIATSNVPNNTGAGTTYISKVVTDGVTVQIELSFSVGGSTTNLGFVATADVSGDLFTRKDFQVVESNIVLEGFVVFGDMTVTASMPAVTNLSASTGALYSGCIQHMTNWLAGLKVGDTTLSGIVELVAGDGINISANSSTNTITISCIGAEHPIDNSQISGDLDILNNVVATYGVPITAINVGGSTQNIEIASISDGAFEGNTWYITTQTTDTISIDSDADIRSIIINDITATACCGEDSLTTLVDNIAELNTRAGLLETAQTQLETNLNTVSTQIARLL